MIRDANDRDGPAIAEVVAAAWRWAYGDLLPSEMIESETDPLARTLLTQRMVAAGNLFIVAEEAGTVVGYALEYRPPEVENWDAEIGALYVHPDFTNMGLGRALVGELARRLWARGACSLAANTLADNPIGRGFYEKIGGKACPSRPWKGYACVWYAWDEAAMVRLIPSDP